VAVESRTGEVVVHLGTESSALTRDQARRLREALGDALTDSNEFVHTVGHHREDGSYVVERRGADSAGHRKVFDSFEALRSLFAELPAEFTAPDVERAGLSGGRRHMLLWHLVEHPAFDCELSSRQPLTVRKPTGGSECAPPEVAGD
jgi:hypothetical protein